MAGQLELVQKPLLLPVPARALDRHRLRTVTHQTQPVRMLMSGNQHELLQFHVLNQPNLALILGLP